jgi:ATP synthase protein I
MRSVWSARLKQAGEFSFHRFICAGVESMADGTPHDDDRMKTPADEAALSARLARLGDKLGHVRPSPSPDSVASPAPASDNSAMARGFRLSTELVGGVIVGGGLGWLIDRWLGTTPWFFIGLVLLGSAGGILNVMRAAGVKTGDGQDRT